MKAFSKRFYNIIEKVSVLVIVTVIGVSAAFAQAQASTADLIGTVVDPTGAIIPGASITVKSPTTGINRTTTSNDSGAYQFIGLPPGTYDVTATAPTFKTVSIPNVTITVGQRAELTVPLEIGTEDIIVTVGIGDIQLVETTSSTVSNTIDQQRIDNLPINERSATGFALTLSTVGRDNGRPVGPAPTSGLNIGGQRGRSTLVQVDGADFTDNSVNAARTTVSQEAVQEYQVATNSYAPEFGRATGGIINVVTKRGTNDFHGNVFGFIRDKSIQANNAFAPVDKPDFRRTQYGGTFGGPIVKEKTFFFASYERRDRDESGFFTSNVAQGLGASFTLPAIPGLNPMARTFNNLTPQQAAALGQLVSVGTPAAICGARAYAFFASSGGTTGLTGSNPLASPNDGSLCPAISPILPGQIGSRFILSGAPIPVGTIGDNGQFIAFRPLNDLQTVFPVTENTNFFSIRGDQNINEANQLTLRFGYNTNDVTGIQVESQNQSLGQNDFSRTGVQDLTDYAFTAGLNSVLSTYVTNEFKFNFGQRNTSFRSQNGNAVAFNISDTAFIGRELFSPVVRTERRFQFADNVNYILGNHTLKFGGDINFVNIPSFIFELNFAGLFNFGPFTASNLNPGFAGLPDFTPVQSYGLGLPTTYIQGFGDPTGDFSNLPLAFFAQDTWRVTRKLTLNYGLRYDIEFTKQLDPVGITDPLSGIALSAGDILTAQDALNVQQGIPVDRDNIAPRFGFAYDLNGDGKTVIRGALGLFYDHPLLAIATNSDIGDASQQQQSVLTAGSPAFQSLNPMTGQLEPVLLNAAQVFQGTVCSPASNNPICPAGFTTRGVAPTAVYQFGRQRFDDQTYTGFGAVLPFTLPISKDFEYAYATQANFAVQRQLTNNMAVTAQYIYVGARHLPHPTDLNTPNTALQIENYRRCFGALPTTTQQVSTVNPALCNNGGAFVNVIPGIISVNPRTGEGVIAPAIANFFRPNAPNYFLAQALSGGAVTPAVLNGALAASNTLRTPGAITPFGAVNAQVSDGNSSYNALNVELKRRFANNFTFLGSYTWAHSIDDSSDLQTLLLPQDPNRFNLERADSLFDQRHRFVFSGVLSSPQGWRSSDSTFKKILANFTVAPIIELSSGRPFNIITNQDTNNDQSSQTDRPSVQADGTLCVPGSLGCTPLITDGRFSIGNLARNRGITHGFASVDLRIARTFRFGERFNLELIAEGFNLFNRFNEAAASPFIDAVNSFGEQNDSGSYYSRPTAAFDPRQFQFGAKFNF